MLLIPSVKLANGYVIAGDAYGIAESSYHIYTGEFSVTDLAGFAPTVGWVGGRILRYSDEVVQLAPDLKSPGEAAFDIFCKNKHQMKAVAPDQVVPALDPTRTRFGIPGRFEEMPLPPKTSSDYIPPDPRTNGMGPPPLFSDN